MRNILLLLIPFALLLNSGLFAKETDSSFHVQFQHQHKPGRIISYKLPLQCRIYLGDEDKRFGKIVAVDSFCIHFEYKDYDTSEVSKILAMDLKRKEKDNLIDSLIDSSKTIQFIQKDSIHKIAILSGDAKTGRKVAMLAGAIGFMGSGFALMASRSNKVGSKFGNLDWLTLGGMGLSAGTMAILTRRVFDMEEWEISP